MLWMPPEPGWLGAFIDSVDNYQSRRARARERLLALGVKPWDLKTALEGRPRERSWIIRKYKRRLIRARK